MSAESIAATTGGEGSSPGRAWAFIVTLVASMPSSRAAAMIVLVTAGFVAESVTMRTCSPVLALAQVRSRLTAPLKALDTFLKDRPHALALVCLLCLRERVRQDEFFEFPMSIDN